MFLTAFTAQILPARFPGRGWAMSLVKEIMDMLKGMSRSKVFQGKEVKLSVVAHCFSDAGHE